MGERETGNHAGRIEELLRLKLAIFALGAAFGVGGMAVDSRLLLSIGTAILLAGVLLRFLPRFRPGHDSHPRAPEEEISMEDDSPAPPEPH